MPKDAPSSRQRIQEALLGLLAERPLRKISVTDVCRAAGVSRTTYYRIYYSQVGIVEDVLDGFFARVGEVVSPPPGMRMSPMAQQAMIYQALELYRQNAERLRVILASEAGGLLRERVGGLTRRLLEGASGAAGRAGLAAGGGEPRPGESCPTQVYLAREFVVAGMVEVTCRWVSTGCELPVEQLVGFMMRAGDMTAGLCAG